MTDVVELVVEYRVYPVVGALLSTVAGTFYLLWTDYGRDDVVIDGQGLVLCILAFAFWPAVLVIVGMTALLALVAVVWGWFEDSAMHTMTWVFAWPYKVAKLIGRCRFRRKVRKLIETGDTGIVDEDTGEIEKEQE